MIRLRNLPFVGLQLTLMADKSQTPLPAWFVQMMDKYEHIEHETCDIDSQSPFVSALFKPFSTSSSPPKHNFRRKNRLQIIGSTLTQIAMSPALRQRVWHPFQGVVLLGKWR